MSTGAHDSTGRARSLLHTAHTASLPHFPLTRASALERWRTAVLSIAGVELAIFAASALVRPAWSAEEDAVSSNLLEPLVTAVVVPLLLVGMTLYGERKLHTRPPKALLLWQFAAFFTGTLIETLVVVLSSLGNDVAPELFLTADGVQLFSFGVMAVWFTGAWLVGRGTGRSPAP